MIFDARFLVQVLNDQNKSNGKPIPSSIKKEIKRQYDKDYGIISSAQAISLHPRKIHKINVGGLETGGAFLVDDYNPLKELGGGEVVGCDMLSNIIFAGNNITFHSGDGYRTGGDNSHLSSSGPPFPNPSLFPINPTFENERRLCILGSFMNVMNMFLCEEEYSSLNDLTRSVETLPTYNDCVDIIRNFKNFEIRELKFFPNEDDDFSWIEQFTVNGGVPIILSIKGFNKSSNHSIAVFQNQILDSVDYRSFPLNRQNLDYCLGDGEKFSGVEKGFALKPMQKTMMKYRTIEGNLDFKFNFNSYYNAESNKRPRKRKKYKLS